MEKHTSPAMRGWRVRKRGEDGEKVRKIVAAVTEVI